jgi:hypothetical protein
MIPKPNTVADIEKKAEELMGSFGPILAESVDALRKFNTPEEGYFFAMELVECVCGHLRKQYTSVPQITAVLDAFQKTMNAVILDKHKETMDALTVFRRGELSRRIETRLEEIEAQEDVDLRPVKRRITELTEKAGDPVGLIELGVRTGAL